MTDVLVLRALGLGDLLASVAALRGLRRAWPGARLRLAAPDAVAGWLVSLGVVDDAVPMRSLDDVTAVPGPAGPPDVAVNLHGRGPASHTVLAGTGARHLVAYACAEAGHDEGPAWHPDEHEVDRWVRLSRWAGGHATPGDLRLPPPGERGHHVVVHPGAASGSRCWPVERFAAVAASLARQGRRVLVTGTAGEAARCAAVAAAHPGVRDVCGRADLAGLGRLVGTAALLLSGDTGVAHVATAFGTPSVALYGPVSPRLWGPRVDHHLHRVLWRGSGDDLRPGDPHGALVDPRLAALGVEEVAAACAVVLARYPVGTGTPSASSSSTHVSSRDA